MAGAAERARRLGGEAARLRDRAALARARGDEGLANSLLDVAKRQSRQAHRLRKEAKASGETKTSFAGEGWDRRRKAAMRERAAAIKAGTWGPEREKAHKGDVEMYSKLAVQAYREDGVRNRRVRKDEGTFAQEVADREAKKLEARRKRDAKERAKAAANASPEARAKRLEEDAHAELWKKKRAFWDARRKERVRRLQVMRRSQRNVADQFVLAQQELAQDRARMTREFKKRGEELDARYGELYETPEEKETFASKHFTKLHAAAGIVSILRQRAKDRRAQHERNMRFDPAYRAKEEAKQAEYDKTRIGRAKLKVRAGLSRALDRVSPSRVTIRQENADEAKAKTELAEAKKASKALRAQLATERKKLKVIRAAYSYDIGTAASRSIARAQIAEQAGKVKSARNAVQENAAKGKAAKAAIKGVADAREARRVGSLGYKLGAPKRAVLKLKESANKRFQVALLSFKAKHGIEKPLLPWQRRTVMQKLFGSDKGYKGVTFHAKGALGMGDAALLGRRGQQGVHPEDHDVASKTPYSLHKGKKGGVYYIGPKGKKVYISHGGVFGFIKAFKSGLGGHRLLR